MSDRLALFRAHLEKNPNDRFALYSVALELKKSGEFEACASAFQRLLAAHPTSGAGWYQHGLVYRERGDIDTARNIWLGGLEALASAGDAEARRSIGEITRALDELDDAD
jgi:tetratricopeptide (TPR) repeat protein